MTAFLDESKGGYESYHRSAEFDEAKGWFEKLLTGSADFSKWIKMENASLWEEYDDEDESSEGEGNSDSLINMDEAIEEKSETDTRQTEEHMKSFWYQLQREQKGQMRGWRQLLVIFGESWHDEHKFFSARDVELAIEGIHEEKYTKAVLEWGTKAFNLFPGVQNDLMVIWCTNNTGRGDTRFLAKEGTVAQVKFWLVSYLNSGVFEEMSSWEYHPFEENEAAAYAMLHQAISLGSAAAVLGALRMDMLTPEFKEIMPFHSIQEAWEEILEKAENGCAFCQYMIGNTYYFLDIIEIEDQKESNFANKEAWNAWKQLQIKQCLPWFEKAFSGGMILAGRNYCHYYQHGRGD